MADRTLAATLKKVEAGTAGYPDAERAAYQIGRDLSRAFTGSIRADELPDGHMPQNVAEKLLLPMLREDHRLVSGLTERVQTALNQAAGIGLQVQTVEFAQDMAEGLVHKLTNGQYEDTSWVLGAPVVNFSQSITDRTLQRNVEFHAHAGLKPRISREAESHCCTWCEDLEGTYDYGSEPKDIYRRHDNCRCEVDYRPGDGRRQGVWDKEWHSDVRPEVASSDADRMGASHIESIRAGDGKGGETERNFKTYKNSNYQNIWNQTNTAESQAISEYLDRRVNSGEYGDIDRIIVAKQSALGGIAAYSHTENALYICEELIDPIKFAQLVPPEYFPARSLDDVLDHELGGHKAHWEAVQRYFEGASGRGISIEQAKDELEEDLRKYVKEKMYKNPIYLAETVSQNAQSSYKKSGLNETIADAIILMNRNGIDDAMLTDLIKKVIGYDVPAI